MVTGLESIASRDTTHPLSQVLSFRLESNHSSFTFRFFAVLVLLWFCFFLEAHRRSSTSPLLEEAMPAYLCCSN